jgi:CheY-like chemotaxis protein
VEWAVDYAMAAKVKRLALFHHDPLHTDDVIDRIVDECRQRAASAGSHLEVFAAAEGLVVDLPEHEVAAEDSSAMPARIEAPIHPSSPLTILIADDDPIVVRLLRATLGSDDFRLLEARDGAAALEIARQEGPALILLDWHMPKVDGLDVCRRLRREPDERLRNVPVVLITAEAGSENMALGLAAGVTDYLRKPFTPAHVRSRVRTWLLRTTAPAEDLSVEHGR